MARSILPVTESFVYVFKAEGTSLCKIGVSADVEGRLKSVQTACPHKVTVLAIWPGSPRLEKRLHRHFDQYRREGEWFELPPFCGLEIYNIVRGHKTLETPQDPEVPTKKRRRRLVVKFKKRGFSKGIAVPRGYELQFKHAMDKFVIIHRTRTGDVYITKNGKVMYKAKAVSVGFLTWEQRNDIRKLSVKRQREEVLKIINAYAFDELQSPGP